MVHGVRAKRNRTYSRIDAHLNHRVRFRDERSFEEASWSNVAVNVACPEVFQSDISRVGGEASAEPQKEPFGTADSDLQRISAQPHPPLAKSSCRRLDWFEAIFFPF